MERSASACVRALVCVCVYYVYMYVWSHSGQNPEIDSCEHSQWALKFYRRRAIS